MAMLPRKKHMTSRASSGGRSTEAQDFKSIMKEATREMPRSQRLFSRFIHHETIWFISEALSKTIARPNAILSGAILSFVITLGVYLLSKNYGYSMSGFESIGAFIIGWTMGTLFDIAFLLLKRK